MFVYSSSTRGWANISGDHDPRPANMQPSGEPGSGLACVASMLRAERTGAGECSSKAGRTHTISMWFKLHGVHIVHNCHRTCMGHRAEVTTCLAAVALHQAVPSELACISVLVS
jgi:hypothetical protein